MNSNHLRTGIRNLGRILPAALLLAALALLAGCATLEKQESTISVDGVGTVSAAPDMVSLTVSLTHLAPTTREAREAVNRMAGQILTMLEGAGIERKDIRTTALNYRPDYEWNNGVQKLLGQRADQTMVFTMKKIRDNEELLSRLLDDLTEVNGLQLQQMTFDIEDKTELYSRSRALAFQKAMDKAEEYASLSGMTVDRVLSLGENQSSAPVPLLTNRLMAEAKGMGGDEAAVLPTGEIEITTRISVFFQMK